MNVMQSALYNRFAGRLLITLRTTESLPHSTRDVVATCRCGEYTVASRGVKRDRPWDEDVLLLVRDRADGLLVDVHNHPLVGKPTLVGQAAVRLDQLVQGRPKDFFVALAPPAKHERCEAEDDEEEETPPPSLKKIGSRRGSGVFTDMGVPRITFTLTAIGFGLDGCLDGVVSEAVRKLIVEVVSAENLTGKDRSGQCHATVKLEACDQCHQTSVVNSKDPSWNEVFVFTVHDTSNPLQVTLLNREQKLTGKAKEQFVGVSTLELPHLIRDRSNPMEVALVDRTGGAPVNDTNNLLLILTPVGFGLEPDLAAEADDEELYMLRHLTTAVLTAPLLSATKKGRKKGSIVEIGEVPKVARKKKELTVTILEVLGDVPHGEDIDAHVWIQFEDTTCQTEEDDDSEHPFWNETFTFDVTNTREAVVYFEIRDAERPIGYCEYNVSALLRDNTEELQIPLTWAEAWPHVQGGEAQLHVMLTPKHFGRRVKNTGEMEGDAHGEEEEEEEEEEKNRVVSKVMMEDGGGGSKGGLKGRRLVVSGLSAQLEEDVEQPSLEIWVGDAGGGSTIIGNKGLTREPHWSDELVVPVPSEGDGDLNVVIWDQTPQGRVRRAEASFPMESLGLIDGREVTHDLPISTGHVGFRLKAVDFGEPHRYVDLTPLRATLSGSTPAPPNCRIRLGLHGQVRETSPSPDGTWEDRLHFELNNLDVDPQLAVVDVELRGVGEGGDDVVLGGCAVPLMTFPQSAEEGVPIALLPTTMDPSRPDPPSMSVVLGVDAHQVDYFSETRDTFDHWMADTVANLQREYAAKQAELSAAAALVPPEFIPSEHHDGDKEGYQYKIDGTHGPGYYKIDMVSHKATRRRGKNKSNNNTNSGALNVPAAGGLLVPTAPTGPMNLTAPRPVSS